MKKLAMALIAMAVLFSAAVLSGQEGYFSGSYVRLNYVQGEVVIQRTGDLGTEQGQVNLVVSKGDKLATQSGRAEIHFGRNNYLRLNDNSQVEIADLPQRQGDVVKLHILSGDVYLRIRNLEREKNFEIHTPDASFYILEEGLYRFRIRDNQETELQVELGSVEAAAEQGSVIVQQGERIIASNGTLGTRTNLTFLREDEFYRWNETRDQLDSSYSSQRYLPTEISEYENELSNSGRWTYESPYGYVWVPMASYSDWRPYYFGRWVWYPVIGWTWVSDEPWGWAVYHYGRWHWRMGLGWYWIPTMHWGPAWVHWYYGDNYYGWCPLSYYNRPVAVIGNSFYDRHYRDDYPLNSRALTVIRKEQIQERRISSVALNHIQLRSLSAGSLKASASQPIIRPVGRHDGISATSKIFSNGQLRKVSGNYESRTGSVGPSQLRGPGTTGIRTERRIGGDGAVSSSSRSVIQRKPSSSEGLSVDREASSSRSSTRSIRTFPASRSGERISGSSIDRPGGATSQRIIRSESGSSFRSDVSPSRNQIKSYAPVERNESSRETSVVPSRDRVIPYSSSSRITRQKEARSDSFSPAPSRSFNSERSSGSIRSDSSAVRSRFQNNEPSSFRGTERPSSREYAAPRVSPSPLRSSSGGGSPSPRVSTPSFRSAPSSSGSASRAHSGSSSGPSTSSRPSSGHIVKKH